MQCNGRSPTRDRQGDGKHPGKDGEWSVAEGKQMATDKGSKEKREVAEQASQKISEEPMGRKFRVLGRANKKTSMGKEERKGVASTG